MTHKTRKYLGRLEEQYYEVKRNGVKEQDIYRKTRYNAMREFCLDLELISLENIEQMEYEVNENFAKTIKTENKFGKQ